MAVVHEATCSCGFKDDVSVGGSRSDFQTNSAFPFYSECCGLVRVNITKLPGSQAHVQCPNCSTGMATQYGMPPASRFNQRSLFCRLMRKIGKTSLVFEWGGRLAEESGHKCPSCKQMTLHFSRYPSVMFD